MISTNTRLQVEYICNRISNGEEVQLSEMTWIQKWASSNRTVYEMLRSARRKSMSADSNLDNFLNDLGLGEPDPQDHLTGGTHPDRIAEWFRRNDGENLDRLRRD